MVKDVFRVHWYWKRYNSDDVEGAKTQRELEALLEQRKQARRHSRMNGLGSPKGSMESSKLEFLSREVCKSGPPSRANSKGLEKTA